MPEARGSGLDFSSRRSSKNIKITRRKLFFKSVDSEMQTTGQSNVTIIIGEPWDFPWESWAAEIQERKNKYLLIKLREKINYKATDVVQLIAEPRSDLESLDCIEEGKKFVICMTPIAGEIPRSMEECLDLAKKWRGWFLQGSIEIDKTARRHRLRVSV